MTPYAIRSIAEDALFERRMKREGSCVANRAGIELIQAADSALPAIEDVVTQIIAPNYSPRNFPGLGYVFGAYLVIGVRADPQRTFSFLRTLSPQLQARAMSVVGTFFSGRNYPKAIRSAMPESLLEFLQQESNSDHIAVRYRAAQALEQINRERTENVYDVFAAMRDRPSLYLRQKTIDALANYYYGYRAALWANRIPCDDGVPPFRHFTDWLQRRFGKAIFSEGVNRGSPKDSFTMISEEYENAEQAFEEFFRLLDEFQILEPRTIATTNLSDEEQGRVADKISSCRQFEAVRYFPDEAVYLKCVRKSDSSDIGYLRTLDELLDYSQKTYGIGRDAWTIQES